MIFQKLYLNEEQLDGLASMVADAGQVFLASLVVPFFLHVDGTQSIMLLSGLVLTLGCYLFSLYLRGRKWQ